MCGFYFIAVEFLNIKWKKSKKIAWKKVKSSQQMSICLFFPIYHQGLKESLPN